MNPEMNVDRALQALRKAKERIEGYEQMIREPIAVIGLGCRFPAGASDPERYWSALAQGVDGVSRVPEGRWSSQEWSSVESMNWASLLQEPIDEFDASFFGISPREAESMDPQQRLLLEVAWEALEHAGQSADALSGSLTGVFLGMSSADYGTILRSTPVTRWDPYFLTGTVLSTAAGRISYTFGFHGPCATIDTACSSSLVATHLACQSLRQRECNLALVGGTNVLLAPETSYAMGSLLQLLSPDGRCRAFDARANGSVRGEGCGVVLLKRLSDARRDGDRILAVIRGSAVNQGGRSSGMTAPNVLAQEAVLRQALAAAQVSAADITYVEAHGFGTSLGDPIELAALKTVLGKPRAAGERCAVASVKSNLGNLEGASGISALIKVVLSLTHEAIPPHLHFETLNPRVSFEDTPLYIPTSLQPWPRGARPRIAGVSSFGLSGTNAHLILEEAPEPLPSRPLPQKPTVLLASAKTPEALTALATSYAAWLSRGAYDLEDVARTAALGRAQHAERLAVVGDSAAELASKLSAFARGDADAGVQRGSLRSRSGGKTLFVFSGDGSQWPRMGVELQAEEPAFREALARCEASLRTWVDWSLTEELGRPEERTRLDDIAILQPALWAIQVALAELWKSWGVLPDAVLGHGVAEIAAAHVAGALTLDEAAALVVALTANGSSDLKVNEAKLPIYSTVAQALRDGYRHVVEVSLNRDKPGRAALLESLGALYAAGASVELPKLFGPGLPAPLPTYPFQRERLWKGNRSARRSRPPAAHPLLGERMTISTEPVTHLWETSIHLEDPAQSLVVHDHKIHGRPWFPGAGYLEMVISAARDAFGDGEVTLADVSIGAGLVFAEGELEHVVQVVLVEEEPRAARFRISSRSGAGFVTHATGTVCVVAPSATRTESLQELQARIRQPSPPSDQYDAMKTLGVELGPTFAGIKALWTAEDEALARIEIPEQASPAFTLYPGFLDCAFQLVGAAARLQGSGPRSMTGMRSLTVWQRPAPQAWVTARFRLLDEDNLECDLRLLDATGAVLVEVTGYRARCVADLAPGLPASAAGGQESTQALRAQLGHASAPERQRLLERLIRDELSAVLKLSVERIDPEQRFSELGLDSLMAMQVRNRLEAMLGAGFPVSDLWEHPSSAALASHLEGLTGSLAGSDSQPTVLIPALPRADRIEQVNGQEVHVFRQSYGQQRLGYLIQADPLNPVYNEGSPVLFQGPLNVTALARAFTEIVARHEALRMTFAQRAGEPVLCVHPPFQVTIPVEECFASSDPDRHARIEARFAAELGKPFELSRLPLMRVLLLRFGPEDHAMIFTVHHMIADAFSAIPFRRELMALYEAFLSGKPSPLAPLPIQFGDYAEWEMERSQGPEGARNLEYWRDQLAGAPTFLELPLDRQRPEIQTYRGETIPIHFSRELTGRLRTLAAREEASLYTIFAAGFHVLLFRFTGAEDFLVGAPVSNRPAGTENLIGFFANTVVLRARLHGQPTFREVVRSTRETVLAALAHQELPLNRLLEELHPERRRGSNPLFQVLFVMQPAGGRETMGTLQISEMDSGRHSSKFDFGAQVQEYNGEYLGHLMYSTDLFERETIIQLASSFQALMQAAAENPDQAISELTLMPETAAT